MYGAVILAAGLSSRMGEFKPLLPLGGSTFLGTLMAGMRAAGVRRIAVVAGWRADALAAALADEPDAVLVRNERFVDTQMFESIQLGLAAFEEMPEKVLVNPVDIPLVAPETMRRLLACDAGCAHPVDVASGRSGHPMMLSAACAERILAHPAGSTLKAALLAMGERPVRVLVDDPAAHLDADTQEGYGELLRYLAERGGRALEPRPVVSGALYVGGLALTEELLRLLELVGICGSLRRASTAMRISYSTAWRRIARAEEELGFALVERSSGGARGGEAHLTEAGCDMLRRWRAALDELRAATDDVFHRHFDGYRLG